MEAPGPGSREEVDPVRALEAALAATPRALPARQGEARESGVVGEDEDDSIGIYAGPWSLAFSY